LTAGRSQTVGSSAPRDAAPGDIEGRLEQFERSAVDALADRLTTGAGNQPGLLAINPLAFPRKVVVDWPQEFPVPPAAAPIVARQFDDERRQLVVDTPPCGYVWIPAPAADAPLPAAGKTPLAEELLLRNEHFEIALSDVTGGIAQVRTYRFGGNRLSQQLAWRFPREKTVTQTIDGETSQRTTWYTDMRLRESHVLCAGPAYGAVETVGDLVDPATGRPIGTFRQTFQIRRGQPRVEAIVELGLEREPEGDPWTNYVAARFAWNDSDLALTRSLHEASFPVKEEQRLESPHYIELASESARTTILTGGLAFHRVTGPRMLDTLLVTQGERRRTFRFAIAVDQSFPLEAALDWESQPLQRATRAGPPAAGAAGWFLRTDSRSVQIRRVLPLRTDDGTKRPGCLVRLQETEGGSRTCRLGCCFPIAAAQQVDFDGQMLHKFRVEQGTAHLSLGPYEICDVEIRCE